jgi:hypothetical protein
MVNPSTMSLPIDLLASSPFPQRSSRNSCWKGLEVMLTSWHYTPIINLALELVTLLSTKRIRSSVRSLKS